MTPGEAGGGSDVVPPEDPAPSSATTEASGEAAASRPRVWLRRARSCALASLGGVGLLVLAMAGAVEREPMEAASYDGPRPVPAELLRRLDYPERGTPASAHAEWHHADGWGWTARWVKLRATTPGFPAHDVQVIHYRPAEQGAAPAPAVVVSPILGGKAELSAWIGGAIARRGAHAVVVLRAQSYLDGEAPPARLDGVLRTALIDHRRAVDWLEALPEVDPARIGALGVSMGGITTAALAGIEPRVRATVIALAGGDVGELVVTSAEPRVARYVKEQAARGLSPEQLRRQVREALAGQDPVDVAPCVDARDVLFVLARRDGDVPFPRQERLWEALGRPERIVLPTGHYTSAAYLPWLLPTCLDWLLARL